MRNSQTVTSAAEARELDAAYRRLEGLLHPVKHAANWSLLYPDSGRENGTARLKPVSDTNRCLVPLWFQRFLVFNFGNSGDVGILAISILHADQKQPAGGGGGCGGGAVTQFKNALDVCDREAAFADHEKCSNEVAHHVMKKAVAAD